MRNSPPLAADLLHGRHNYFLLELPTPTPTPSLRESINKHKKVLMANLETPPSSKGRTGPPSPSIKSDGISMSSSHLPRTSVVQEIYSIAKTQQHVVVGSSAATGKTSLLQLLAEGLEAKGANVF